LAFKDITSRHVRAVTDNELIVSNIRQVNLTGFKPVGKSTHNDVSSLND